MSSRFSHDIVTVGLATLLQWPGQGLVDIRRGAIVSVPLRFACASGDHRGTANLRCPNGL